MHCVRVVIRRSTCVPIRLPLRCRFRLNGTLAYPENPADPEITDIRAALAAPHPRNNVPPSIAARVGARLHLRTDHPLGQLKLLLQHYFESGDAGAAPKGSNERFETFDRLSPLVTVRQNFDDLLTPLDHVSRAPSDTYYVDDSRLLRCHMTAHQADLIRAGRSAWLMIGDVYRRDEVDATHYPVFHQVDGVRVWGPDELPLHASTSVEAKTEFIMADLRATLEGLVRAIFGDVPCRWVPATFPFTDPSLELEILYEGRWLEVLGCGAVRTDILQRCGRPSGSAGWAFGMGLERLAMVRYSIPDIRLFWSEDPRFLGQFAKSTAGDALASPVSFVPYSKYPPCYKDITFWLPIHFHENDLHSLVRDVAGDLVESVTRVDAFTHPITGRVSHCYRINYRSMDRNLTNEEVDILQLRVRAQVSSALGAELR